MRQSVNRSNPRARRIHPPASSSRARRNKRPRTSPRDWAIALISSNSPSPVALSRDHAPNPPKTRARPCFPATSAPRRPFPSSYSVVFRPLLGRRKQTNEFQTRARCLSNTADFSVDVALDVTRVPPSSETPPTRARSVLTRPQPATRDGARVAGVPSPSKTTRTRAPRLTRSTYSDRSIDRHPPGHASSIRYGFWSSDCPIVRLSDCPIVRSSPFSPRRRVRLVSVSCPSF